MSESTRDLNARVYGPPRQIVSRFVSRCPGLTWSSVKLSCGHWKEYPRTKVPRVWARCQECRDEGN